MAQQGTFAGFGLPAAGRSAPAADSGGIDEGVTGLAGVASRTESGIAAEDHADPDPDLAGDEEQVGDARPDTATMLAEGAEVGLVGDGDRNLDAEATGQHLAEGHIAPAEVGCEVDESVRPSREPDDGDADAGEVVLDGHRRQQRLGELDGILDRLARGESTTRTVDADTVVQMATESDRRHGDRVDSQLDGEDDSALGVGGNDW